MFLAPISGRVFTVSFMCCYNSCYLKCASVKNVECTFFIHLTTSLPPHSVVLCFGMSSLDILDMRAQHLDKSAEFVPFRMTCVLSAILLRPLPLVP